MALVAGLVKNSFPPSHFYTLLQLRANKPKIQQTDSFKILYHRQHKILLRLLFLLLFITKL